MKKVILLLVLAALGAGLTIAYREMRTERDMEADAEAPVIAESRVTLTAAGATVALDPETRNRLGVASSVLIAATTADEVTGTARVLDGASLTAQLADLHAAEALFQASRAAYERLRKLAAEGQNASMSAVEAADAARKRDEAACDAARGKITAEWGPAIAGRSDLALLAAALLRREQALILAELPATEHLDMPPETAVIERLDGFTSPAHYVGPAPSSVSPFASQCLLYLVTEHAESLATGSSATARLARPGKTTSGWLLPRDAVLRHSGRSWIYVEIKAGIFERRPIDLDHPHPEGWLVVDEIAAPVVHSGAQSLLSEELKGEIQMGD
jgi:hypothetical protein